MRLSSILPFMLAAAPAVTARGTLGLSLGDKNADGSCKETGDWENDFRHLKTKDVTTLVRTYSATECNTAERILPAAEKEGFKVVLGVW